MYVVITSWGALPGAVCLHNTIYPLKVVTSSEDGEGAQSVLFRDSFVSMFAVPNLCSRVECVARRSMSMNAIYIGAGKLALLNSLSISFKPFLIASLIFGFGQR